jgi:alpha-ketoglutarate-dependent taurine dioxygenase
MNPETDAARELTLDLAIATGGVPILHSPAGQALGQVGPWLAARRNGIRRELHKHGFLMIRGLPVRAAADVAIVRAALTESPAMNGERTAQRTHFGADVYSANDLPPGHRIGFHNENSYALEFPAIIIFSCLEAPSSGGCTAVVDCRRVLADVAAEFSDSLRSLGWRLTRHYHPHVGQAIKSAFESDDPSKIAEHCEANLIGHQWLSGGVLRTVQRRAAVVRHPTTNEETLFSHMSFWSRWSLPEEVRQVLVNSYGDDRLPFDTAFGDGTPITKSEMDVLNQAYERHACREPWRVGDVLIVDNLLAAHARDPFRGKRRVVVTMAELLQVGECTPSVAAAAA